MIGNANPRKITLCFIEVILNDWQYWSWKDNIVFY